ncbi:hypothetical protein ACFLZP_00310 [Patescibacteria group bacterium]
MFGSNNIFLFLSYVVWIGLVLIAILGVAKEKSFKEIKSRAGMFLLLIILGAVLYYFYRKNR